MDGHLHLSGLELEIDLRATALGGFMAALSGQHADLLATLDDNGWMLARESRTVAEILQSHRRILERFLAEQAEILKTRVEAEIETDVVAALAEHEALALSPTALERVASLTTTDRRLRSLSTHPSNTSHDGTETAIADGTDGALADAQHPVDDAALHSLDGTPTPAPLDPSMLFGTDPSLERGEVLINQLIDQWARHELDEAKALVDDAHARAAVLLHVAAIDSSEASTHQLHETTPPEMADDIATLLAPGGSDTHDQLRRLATSLGEGGPLQLTDDTWSDAIDATSTTTAPDDAASPTQPTPGAEQHIDVLTLDDEQLEVVFADFWQGDLARNALDTLLADSGNPTVRHAAMWTSRRQRAAARRQGRRNARPDSTLVSGITPIIAITGLITILMALLG